MKIAVVVPSNNLERCDIFRAAWEDLFNQHKVILFIVCDVEKPGIICKLHGYPLSGFNPDFHLDHRFDGLINFKTDGVRNYGFIEAVKAGADVVITLDDDVFPDGNDPIQEHLDALDKSYPISWFNPFEGAFMRGFPYGIRAEARAVVSHGIWTGIQDFDAPTTLVRGTAPVPNTYHGAIPKGCLTPVCGMNLAFLREVAPFVYFAPMAGDTGFNRFADIWMGVHLKQELDARGLAMVHGFSTVQHERQSNVFNNLNAEAAGIALNEHLGLPNTEAERNYIEGYLKKREEWKRLMEAIL